MTLRGAGLLGTVLVGGTLLLAGCNQSPPDSVGRAGVGVGSGGELEIHYDTCGESGVSVVSLTRGREGLADDEENPILAEVTLDADGPGAGTVVFSTQDLPGGIAGLEADVTHIAEAIPEHTGESLVPVTFTPDQLTGLAPEELLVGEDGDTVAADQLRDC